MAKIASILKADMSLPFLAQELRKKGRGKDTMLAHITPREARMLKEAGGSGTINPATGLPEYDTSFWDSLTEFFSPSQAEAAPAPQQVAEADPAKFTNRVDTNPATPPDANANFQGASYDPNWMSGYTSAGYNQPGMEFTPYNQPFSGTAPMPAPRPPELSLPDIQGQYQPQDQTVPQDAGGQTTKLQDRVNTDPTKASFLDRLTQDPLKLALGLGGLGMGIYGQSQARSQANNLASQIAAIAEQQKTMAQPYLTQGATQYGQAVQGALTPVQQQQFDAARAQIAQQASRTGAVGAMQATALEERMRQQALNSQLTAGLQILGTGNTVMNNAFANEIQALQTQGRLAGQAAQIGGQFFTALGNMLGRQS